MYKISFIRMRLRLFLCSVLRAWSMLARLTGTGSHLIRNNCQTRYGRPCTEKSELAIKFNRVLIFSTQVVQNIFRQNFLIMTDFKKKSNIQIFASHFAGTNTIK